LVFEIQSMLGIRRHISNDMRVRRHTIDDLEIVEFNASAHGRWVIFLHGGPGMLGYMETFCESFSSHCNVVYYEQRGSKQGDNDIGIFDHLRDLKRIVDHYSEESKPIIVGHSWGAMLAVLFAGNHSRLLQKVVLCGCGPLNKTQEAEFQNTLNTRFGDRKDYYDGLWYAIGEESDEEQQQRLVDHYIDKIMEIYQMDPVSGLEIQPLHWDYKGSYRTMSESGKYVSENKYEAALPRIETSLSVIHGSYDVISPKSLFTLVRKHVTHARTIEITKAGHYPWAGVSRDEFIESLKEEINEHIKSGPTTPDTARPTS